MSIVICKKTGIVSHVRDSLEDSSNSLESELQFNLSHPLAAYQQVEKTFRGRMSVPSKDANMGQLLAGSLITVLNHHSLLRLHHEDEALEANACIRTQAKSNGQLLALLHRLLKNKERLSNVAQPNKKRGEEYPRQVAFSLEACKLQGQECREENKYFLASLQQWISTLLPHTVEESLALDKKRTALNPVDYTDIVLVELEDGTTSSYDKILEAVKNSLEDDVARKSKRLSIIELRRKALDQIRLAGSYGIFNKGQVKTLETMHKEGILPEVVLLKALKLLENAGNIESNVTKRDKIYSIGGWLRALKHAAGLITNIDLGLTIETPTETDKKESLQDRLNRIRRGK